MLACLWMPIHHQIDRMVSTTVLIDVVVGRTDHKQRRECSTRNRARVYVKEITHIHAMSTTHSNYQPQRCLYVVCNQGAEWYEQPRLLYVLAQHKSSFFPSNFLSQVFLWQTHQILLQAIKRLVEFGVFNDASSKIPTIARMRTPAHPRTFVKHKQKAL